MKRVAYIGAPEGHEAAADALSTVATVIHVDAEPDALASALASAHGLLDASMKVRITDEMIFRAVRLKVISCATTGSDHIARKVLAERGIPIRTLGEDPQLLRNLTPAAEHSWALLMACARKLHSAVNHVRSGGWNREKFPGVMLNGKQLGLVGCGRIGGWMARYGHAFGMHVVGHDPYVSVLPETIVRMPLMSLFESSDFVSVHVHLSSETEGLISRPLIESMKPSAVLINTSRGAVVDEDALVDALKFKRLAGAGLDVLTKEPDIGNHPLVELCRDHDNLLVTPHCGGFSPDAVKVVCFHAAGKIREVLREG